MRIPIWDRMNLRDQLNLERLWRRRPVVSVLRFEGVIMPRQRRGGLSLASHAGAIERAFRASGLVAVAIVVNSPGGSPPGWYCTMPRADSRLARKACCARAGGSSFVWFTMVADGVGPSM